MYPTIEAELKNGRVIPAEPDALPDSGKVLIVVLSEGRAKRDWQACRDELGWLKTGLDAAEWERSIRGEWDHRP